jgi:hypothetical protein
MAMPPPIVEDLREATYDLEDIWSLIPPGMLTMLRLEMYTAHFNAEAMREDGVEDLPAYNEHLKAEMEKQAEIDEMTLGQMTPRQEDGIEIDPMDDDGRIGAANPETLGELLLANQEDLAVQNLKFLMKSEVPVHETQAVGMTIKEVIDRYNPDVQVRCPYKDDCGEIDFGEYKTCPHSDYHKVGVDCFAPCPFHEKYVSCKPMEDFANEEDIS